MGLLWRLFSTSPSTMTSDSRKTKLAKTLDAIINGKQDLTLRTNTLFLEAIYTAPDAATCLSKIVASNKGLACLQKSMWFDLTPTFFNNHAAKFLEYISATSDLASIGGGAYLRQALTAIVQPPIFWKPLTEAFRAGQLQEKAQFGFAWLLLQLIQLPEESASSYREISKDPVIIGALDSSSDSKTRLIAQKIKHINAAYDTGESTDLDNGPGGRHDNDFTNFREIAILPTFDELVTKDPPFLRVSTALDDSSMESNRLAIHLDNQFRLLREDMVYEIRDEVQTATGVKKRKHRGFIVDGLTIHGCHDKTASNDRRCKWGIAFQCHNDIWQFKGIKEKDRREHLRNNRKIFPHQSTACLFVDGEVVAFPTINRDEDLLEKKPPIIVLLFEGQKSISYALTKLYRGKQFKLVQIDTAIFAYEPILKALQEKQILSLSHELLFWTEGSSIESPQSQPIDIVKSVKANHGRNLESLLKTSSSINLDPSQTNSLISGLTQTVALIQGPPGMFVFIIIPKV
jgi:hypothetical protein